MIPAGKKNILICPLEWGLGHAGRMIPLAVKLSRMGHNLMIGSGPEHIAFFQKETDGLKYINFRGFRIKYSAWMPQYIIILLNIPILIYHIIREHYYLKGIIKKHSVDIVISDSRPGLWNRRIITVFVSHIPGIPMPHGLKIIQKAGFIIGRFILNRYNYFFIPDLPGDINLSGSLSHGVRLTSNARFIGLLSRFSGSVNNRANNVLPGTCTVILSGPEPQRTILRRHAEEFLLSKKYIVRVLGGKPEGPLKTNVKGNIEYISHLTSEEMGKVIRMSELIITRSGYTTLMELVTLGKSALIVPTPGQPEQEYLAVYLGGKGWFLAERQENLDALGEIILPEPLWPANMISSSEELLNIALAELLEKNHQDNNAC